MPGPGTPSRWSQMSEPPERVEGVKLSDIQASVPYVQWLGCLPFAARVFLCTADCLAVVAGSRYFRHVNDDGGSQNITLVPCCAVLCCAVLCHVLAHFLWFCLALRYTGTVRCYRRSAL